MENSQIALYAGILFWGALFLIAMAVLLRVTGGLFFSRMPQDYVKHQKDPRFDLERRVGTMTSHSILKYVPPFAIGFFVIMLLAWLKVF